MEFSKKLVKEYEGVPGLYIVSPLKNPDRLIKIGIGMNLARRINSYVTCFVNFKVHAIITMNWSRQADFSNTRNLETKILREFKNYRTKTADNNPTEWMNSDIVIDYNDNMDEDIVVNTTFDKVMKILDNLDPNSDMKPIRIIRFGKLSQTRHGKKFGGTQIKTYKTGFSKNSNRILKPTIKHFTRLNLVK